MEFTTNKDIQEFLDKNYLEDLKKASVNDLLRWWMNVATRVGNGDYVEEYLNNMFVREAIEKIKELIDEQERQAFLEEVEKIDNVFREKTLEIEKPFWTRNDDWKKSQWFYNRAPQHLIESEKLIIK